MQGLVRDLCRGLMIFGYFTFTVVCVFPTTLCLNLPGASGSWSAGS